MSGLGLVGNVALDVDAAISLGRLIAELASLNSECLDGALRNHASLELPVAPLADHEWAMTYEIAGIATPDPDDRYRFGKFIRRWKTVAPLEVMTSDGLADDIYGNWTDVNDRPGVF